MFCSRCGAPLASGALFCGRCGDEVQQPQITEFYHGTSVEAAMSIQATGFDVSRTGSNAGAMLGPGLYVTTTLQKALNYASQGHRPHGGAVLKLKVNLGNCYTVKHNDPDMSTWQQRGYDSAWSGDGVNGKREEHCIKDPRPPRVQIVDVILANTRKAGQGDFMVANGRIVQGGATGQYPNSAQPGTVNHMSTGTGEISALDLEGCFCSVGCCLFPPSPVLAIGSHSAHSADHFKYCGLANGWLPIASHWIRVDGNRWHDYEDNCGSPGKRGCQTLTVHDKDTMSASGIFTGSTFRI